jgi:hypothetical protein
MNVNIYSYAVLYDRRFPTKPDTMYNFSSAPHCREKGMLSLNYRRNFETALTKLPELVAG